MQTSTQIRLASGARKYRDAVTRSEAPSRAKLAAGGVALKVLLGQSLVPLASGLLPLVPPTASLLANGGLRSAASAGKRAPKDSSQSEAEAQLSRLAGKQRLPTFGTRWHDSLSRPNEAFSGLDSSAGSRRPDSCQNGIGGCGTASITGLACASAFLAHDQLVRRKPLGLFVMRGERQALANVAAARSSSHMQASVRRAFRDLLDTMNPALPTMIRTGDHVLVKPFLRHGRAGPESRMISHPEVIRMVIEAVKDCGAVVTLGDAATENYPYDNDRSQVEWIHNIAKQLGAKPVSFSARGARYVKSRVAYPKRYLLSRAVLDVDKVVGCANLQPHGLLVLSGATKNMFNAVVGKCQQQLHDLYPHPSGIARVIVDVCSKVKPTVSFLDLTTVVDYECDDNINNVGMLLAGSDPIALDTVAAKLIGFRPGDIPTIHVGNKYGLGCSDPNRISVTGLDWQVMQMEQAKKFPVTEHIREGFYDRATRFINKVLLRPNPFIDQTVCTGCHECQRVCPVQAMDTGKDGLLRIDLQKCAQCHLCIESCSSDAISLQFGDAAKAIRRLMKKSL